MLRKLVLGVAFAALAAAPAVAQNGSFRVGPRLGYVKYAEKTGIEAGAMVGLDGLYYISSNLGIGFTLDVSRPQTDSSFFPAEMSFGDTTFIFGVSQPLTIAQFGLQAEFSAGGSIAPFIMGGVNGYRVSLDPQVAAGPANFVELGFSVGGGVAFRTSAGTQIRLEARDFVFTDFDRSRLNVVRAAFQPTRFPDVLPVPDPFSGSAHNIHVALSFSFTPGGSQ
ncbi:MAG TPA: outer membrane beta-barrel protein [Gemmatimonadales bacterium]